MLLFLALWLPLPVAIGFSNYYVNHHTSIQHLQWHLDLQLVAFCFGMLTAATNPIIYGLAIKSFRLAFRKLARKDKNRWKNGCVMCRCDCYVDCGLVKENPKK